MAQQNKTFFKKEPLIEFEGDVYRKQEKASYCGVCGKKTNYKSVYAVEYCCSEECSREIWSDIFMKLYADKRRRSRR